MTLSFGINPTAKLAALFAASLMASGMPALAQDQGVFTPPAGCTGNLTVQTRNCQVSIYYTCAADPVGHKWRVDFEDGGTPTYLGLIDGQAQWIESYDFFPNSHEISDLPAADPMSFDELAKSGFDNFDFNQNRDDGRITRVTGQDRLTGKTIVIDGQPLLQTDFIARESHPDGTLIWEARGSEFIHLEMRYFFAGRATITLNDRAEEFQRNHTPVDFIFAGEPGFMSPSPEYDCSTIISRIDPLIDSPKEKG